MPQIIAISGGTGSGKSTLTKLLVEGLPEGKTSVIVVDWYYKDRSHLSYSEREKINYDHPDSHDFGLFRQDLYTLKLGLAVDCPQYDYSIHNRIPVTKRIEPKEFLIIEGILSLHDPEIVKLVDFSIFVDAPETLRFERRIARDTAERGRTKEFVIWQWNTTVKPMHDLYCETSKKVAKIVIDGSQNFPPEVEKLKKILIDS